MKMKMKNIKSDYLIILMPVIYVAAAIAVVVLVSANGSYPTGSLSLPSRGPFHLSFTVLCTIGH